MTRKAYVREQKVGTHTYFVVDYTFAGDRTKKSFDTRAEAEEFAKTAKKMMDQSFAPKLLANQRLMDLVAICWRRFGEEGFLDVLQGKVYGSKDCPSVAVASTEYLAALTERKLSERHLANVSQHLKAFSRDIVLSSVTISDVSSFLSKFDSAKTRLNYRTTLIAFFRYCQRVGYLPEGRTVADRTEVPKVSTTTPEIFTPEEMRKLLTVADRSVKTFLVLGGFCGIRTAEVHRLRWSHWNAETKSIMLPSEVTKTSKRRVINVEPNAEAWLNLLRRHDSDSLIPQEQTLRARIRKCCEEAGVEWKPNALRHSYASYHLEKFRNAAQTAKNLGHAVGMLETVYLQLANHTAAEEWFNILPQ